MYVSNLDRPWLETPFLLQGFMIESYDDIKKLREHCEFVYVDSRRSKLDESTIKRKVRSQPRQTKQQLFTGRNLKPHEDQVAWNVEFPQAEKAVAELSRGVDEIFDQASRGDGLDVVRVRKAVEPIIESILRNPDACIWLALLKQQDAYTYQHSLGTAIWSVALGRQLGLPKSDLRSLAIGGLLFDVGKLCLEPELLSTDRPLTEDDYEKVRSHVSLGVEMIRETGLMNQDVLDMIAHHHERHDGSGYPAGLSGSAIPVFARIAAIVDCYDAVTSHRPYASAITPISAIKLLNERKGIDFQPELVEEFIQAVGIYPAGSLVELSSGEVAVVVAQYRTQRLRPQVMVMLDAEKHPLPKSRMLDLKKETRTAGGKPLEIVASLKPEAYGINMAAIKL